MTFLLKIEIALNPSEIFAIKGQTFTIAALKLRYCLIMSHPTFDHELDTRGLRCPEPVMMLHQSIRGAQAGECIKVVATDPSTQRDIPKFCGFLGHSLVESIGPVDDTNEGSDPNQMVYVYWVQKKAG